MLSNLQETSALEDLLYSNSGGKMYSSNGVRKKLPEILFITSYPPRECGIATYSQDLIKALNNKFENSFRIRVCPIESKTEKHSYEGEIKYILNTDVSGSFSALSNQINEDVDLQIVVVQHEFGFFENCSTEFAAFLRSLKKPVILDFHTVLPSPNEKLKKLVVEITDAAASIIVMTHSSEKILIQDYKISPKKVTVIPHGTHLVPHSDKALLKRKYGLTGRFVLSTFGLLGPGKSIETTLAALPVIVADHPEILFLVIGKTHPSIVQQDGEEYRTMLKNKVNELDLNANVQFINSFLPLPELLEYLQLTDVYLFTSKDPNQAVSGTFSYAISCGCPVISTPIPHAREVLQDDAGIIVDFGNAEQLANAIKSLLKDSVLRNNMSSNGLHRMASTSWENASITHGKLFEKVYRPLSLSYKIPEVNLDHMKKLTTRFGMIQFSIINQPDIKSGYTLDDNARAMVAFCQHYELTGDKTDLRYIAVYLRMISFCAQSDGTFLNYVDEACQFTPQNQETNLADSNGRAIWALGYVISMAAILPQDLVAEAESTLKKSLVSINKIHSTRAMAFIIKGLYYKSLNTKSESTVLLTTELANRLLQMYRHESDKDWLWFESYLTYANSTLPEAMLCAFIVTGDLNYKNTAQKSFDFLLSKIFAGSQIKVITNKNWLKRGPEIEKLQEGGEQPIDVAYTILALKKFYEVFKDEKYLHKMRIAFEWFLGNNHLNHIVYNPCTGGCYDGLEHSFVNLNQGAESTVSYHMARFAIEKTNRAESRKTQVKESYVSQALAIERPTYLNQPAKTEEKEVKVIHI